VFDTSPNGIKRLARQGEGPNVEFKTRFTADSLIGRYVSAFANSGGGIIIFGVSDSGEILGLPREEEEQTLNRLKRLAESLLPIYVYRVGSVQVDGKSIVYLTLDEAPESERPIRLATGDALEVRDGVVVEMAEAEVTVKPSRSVKVFVAMSFRREEEPALEDYFEAMKRASLATKLPIKLVRLDLVEGDYEISQQIMDEIDSSDIVVADFTLSPSNVYFEVGYARGRKLRIIQTARKGTNLEFDTRNWRTTFYKNATELEKSLERALKEAYAEVVGKSN
jgi:nucleoside 2-deoxyribosyltransferase